MLSASQAFKKTIAQNTKVQVGAYLYTPTLTYLATLSPWRFMDGATTFSDAVSESGSFEIGAAITRQVSFVLNNHDGFFDEMDLSGAILHIYVGADVNGTVEWVDKGWYFMEDPCTRGNTISVDALDTMVSFEKPYANVTGLGTTATFGEIVRAICTYCGVTLATTTFNGYNQVVDPHPDDDTLTCLAVLSYIAQATGNWARIGVDTSLYLKWYDTSYFEGEDALDGGSFEGSSTPYADGDTADGGDFTDYTGGAVADGGEFSSPRFAYIHAYSSLKVVTDDVVITGLAVAEDDAEDEDEGGTLEGKVYLYDSEGQVTEISEDAELPGYVLSIGDNPFIQYGKGTAIANLVGPRVVGMRFRPFEVSALGNPLYEAGDPVIIVDAAQHQFKSYLTSVTYNVGSFANYSCEAETPSRNSAATYSALTRLVTQLRNSVQREFTAYDIALSDLQRELDDAPHLYTYVDPNTGWWYLCDQPTPAESTYVVKITPTAIGFSTDGGQTYANGLTVDGNAILNNIWAAGGISAAYLTSGAITIEDPNTHDILFYANIDTGEVIIGNPNSTSYITLDTSRHITIGGDVTIGNTDRSTLTEIADNLEGVQGEVNDLGEWFHIGSNGLDIGRESENVHAHLDATSLNFDVNDITQLSVGNEGVSTDQKINTPYLGLGIEGSGVRYAWVVDEGTGNLYLKRVK